MLMIYQLDSQVPPHLLCGPLEASHYAVLDLVEVLYTLGDVSEDIGPSAVGPEAPNLAGLSHIPFIPVSYTHLTLPTIRA